MQSMQFIILAITYELKIARYYNALALKMVPTHELGSACRRCRLALIQQNKATTSFRFLQQAYFGLRFGLRLPHACATPPPIRSVYRPDLRLGCDIHVNLTSLAQGLGVRRVYVLYYVHTNKFNQSRYSQVIKQ